MEHKDEKHDEKAEQKEIKVPDVLPPLEDEGQEKLIYGVDFGQRRELIKKPWESQNAIIQCTGRIISWFGRYKQDGSTRKYGRGTGTVFKVEDGEAFIITVAHNVIGWDANAKKGKLAKEIKFRRRIEGPGLGVAVDYPVQTLSIYPGYTCVDECSNDLALVTITDIDGFYGKFFKEHGKDVITLDCSEGIFTKYPENKYGIYGYPGAKLHVNSPVQDGQMWGMEANAYKIEEKENEKIVMYIKERDGGLFIDYTAIDTERGQSGSALYLKRKDKDNVKDKYAIIGIHAGGRSAEYNFATALNEEKNFKIIQLLKLRKPLPLDIHSHRGHNKKYHPRHLLRSIIDKKDDDNRINHYWSDDSSNEKTDWIIFQLKNEKNRVHIGKIRIKNYVNRSALRGFSLYIGSADTGVWKKMHADTLKAEMKEGYQYFFLERGFKTDKDGTMFKLVMDSSIVKFYEFALLATHYDP